MNDTEKRVTIEFVQQDEEGGFGFRIAWNFDDYSASFDVHGITAMELGDGGAYGAPMFDTEKGEHTTNPDEAEKYLKGFIKWDGCSNFIFSPDSPHYMHFCGPKSFKDHCDLMKHLYHRAFELMGREPEEKWPE